MSKIRITVLGMPTRELCVEEDTAEVLFEALAEVLGVKVDFDWVEKEPDAEVGTVYVERLAG
jgi:hypothetical protein